MNATRANRTADPITNAVQAVASAARHPEAPALEASPAAPPENRTAPVAAPPLLSRLEYGIRFTGDEGHKLQPILGASATVGRDDGQATSKVWLRAAVWQGLATIIRQTPDWWRNDVAEFLEALHSSIRSNDPVGRLLGEVIAEVRSDPYKDAPEHDYEDFDTVW